MTEWIKCLFTAGYNLSTGLVIVGVLLFVYVCYCAKNRRWPTEEGLVELAAYGASIYGSGKLVLLSFAKAAEPVDSTIFSFVGALLLTFVSVKGIWRQFKKDPIYTAEKQT